MKKLLVSGLVAVLAATQAQAQAAKTSKKSTAPAAQSSAPAAAAETGVKLEAVKPADAAPKTGEADVDEVITNRKLRAETGSKNKFSFSAALNYAGGSIKNPGDEVRPNITGALGTQTDVRLGGSVGVKYKLTAMQSLSADIGVGVDKPFHSDDRSIGQRSTADNPGVTYQLLSKVGGIQSVTQIGVNSYTSEFFQKMGYLAGLSLAQIAVYDFGGSKFSLGGYFRLSTNFFNKDTDATTTMNGRTITVGSDQGDAGAGIYPFAELVISDRLNLRTISGLWVYDHQRTQSDFWTWEKNKIYQSVGLGISVTRDFYLYPNIQFMPENIKDERTNVALNANINL